jgi:hypothetical protein
MKLKNGLLSILRMIRHLSSLERVSQALVSLTGHRNLDYGLSIGAAASQEKGIGQAAGRLTNHSGLGEQPRQTTMLR